MDLAMDADGSWVATRTRISHAVEVQTATYELMTLGIKVKMPECMVVSAHLANDWNPSHQRAYLIAFPELRDGGLLGWRSGRGMYTVR